MDIIPNITIVYQLVIFLVLLFLLSKLLFKPLLDMFDRREKLITEPIRKAEELDKENEKISSKYQTTLAENLMSAESAKAERLREAAKKEQEILQKTRQENETLLSGLRQEMAQSREKAIADLHQEVDAFSAEITQTILGRKLS